MFTNNKFVTISGKDFDRELFNNLIIQFKEAFSHSSSSIENAFDELDKVSSKLELNRDYNSYKIYCSKSESDKKIIDNTLHQMVTVLASRNLVIDVDIRRKTQEEINDIYEKNFKFFDKEILYFVKFDELNNFNSRETFPNIQHLFSDMYDWKNAYINAYNMQKDNLDAFDYAISLDKINVLDIIEINKIINKSNPNREEGFKRTNNDIISASFTPTDKKEVPSEIQRLMYEYNNGFGKEILDINEIGLDPEEKRKRLQAFFEREALFHIRFERIHPFADGNGRTGRIILNYNLLNQNLAPVLITNVISNDYKKYINEYDVEGLSKLLLNSSSQQMMNWVSAKKIAEKGEAINLNNDDLAELIGYDDLLNIEETKGKKR